MKEKFSKERFLILNGDVLHMRCIVHILNLIVKDGLNEVCDSIARIQNVIRYVRSSPMRARELEHFNLVLRVRELHTRVQFVSMLPLNGTPLCRDRPPEPFLNNNKKTRGLDWYVLSLGLGLNSGSPKPIPYRDLGFKFFNMWVIYMQESPLIDLG